MLLFLGQFPQQSATSEIFTNDIQETAVSMAGVFCLHVLTHCRLNRLSHTINWKSQISILGTAGYGIYIPKKMAKLFANSGYPDQTPTTMG